MNKILISLIMCMLLTTSVFALEIEEIKQLNFLEKIFSFFSTEQQVLADKPKYTQGDLITITDYQDINSNCENLLVTFYLTDSNDGNVKTTTKELGKTAFATVMYKVTQDSSSLNPGWYEIIADWRCKLSSGKWHLLQSNGNLATDATETSKTAFNLLAKPLPTTYSCDVNKQCIPIPYNPAIKGKYTTSNCDNQCNVAPPVDCTTGQTKCIGDNFNVCSNGKWSDSGLVKDKCDVECTKNSHCSQIYDQRPYCKGDSVYTQVRAGVCENNECDSTSSEQLLEVCDNGCVNGKCKNVPPPNCVEGTSQDCMTQGQIGTQTCVSNQWSTCVLLPPTCDDGDKKSCVINEKQGEKVCSNNKWSACTETQTFSYWIGMVIGLFVVFFFSMFEFILIS